MDEWKKIKDFENYSVSRNGKVRNDKTRRILKKQHDKKGYERINLWKNGKVKRFGVHRLVAEAFIPNPENLPCVDHINTVKTDNSVENLKWVTHKENNNNPLTLENYSKAKKGKQLSKEHKRKISENRIDKKIVICLTTGEIYESVMEAERQTGIKHSSIYECCNGKRKSAGKDKNKNKLVWKYLED